MFVHNCKNAMMKICQITLKIIYCPIHKIYTFYCFLIFTIITISYKIDEILFAIIKNNFKKMLDRIEKLIITRYNMS